MRDEDGVVLIHRDAVPLDHPRRGATRRKVVVHAARATLGRRRTGLREVAARPGQTATDRPLRMGKDRPRLGRRPATIPGVSGVGASSGANGGKRAE